MWVQSEAFMCPYVVLNLNISFNFSARLGCNVIGMVCKMYEDKKIEN